MVTFRPSLKTCMGQVMMRRALSLLLGWPGRETMLLCRGSTCNTQHGPIPTQVGSSTEPLHTLWPCCRCSRGRQHQELPVARCAHGGSHLSSRVLRTLVAGLAACLLDRVQACPRGYNGRSWPEGPIWRWDTLGQAAVQADRQLPSGSEKEADIIIIIIIIIIIMVASITPYNGAWYQRGHGLGSIFKGLFHSAIPLLKGPVPQAGVRLAGNVLRGKTMKQALKNRVTLLVGDLVQVAGMQPARKHATLPKRWASKRRAPVRGRIWKCPRHGDIFAW